MTDDDPVLYLPVGDPVPLRTASLARLAYEYRNAFNREVLDAIAAEFERRDSQTTGAHPCPTCHGVVIENDAQLCSCCLTLEDALYDPIIVSQ